MPLRSHRWRAFGRPGLARVAVLLLAPTVLAGMGCGPRSSIDRESAEAAIGGTMRGTGGAPGVVPSGTGGSPAPTPVVPDAGEAPKSPSSVEPTPPPPSDPPPPS